MNRIPLLSTAVLLAASFAAPAWAQQQLQPPTATSPQPAVQQPPANPTIPSNPVQRAHPVGTIPEAGPSNPVRPAPTTQPLQRAPATPAPVRDAQGRIVPDAQQTIPGRARDPVTGEEFQTTPTPTRP